MWSWFCCFPTPPTTTRGVCVPWSSLCSILSLNSFTRLRTLSLSRSLSRSACSKSRRCCLSSLSTLLCRFRSLWKDLVSFLLSGACVCSGCRCGRVCEWESAVSPTLPSCIYVKKCVLCVFVCVCVVCSRVVLRCGCCIGCVGCVWLCHGLRGEEKCD